LLNSFQMLQILILGGVRAYLTSGYLL